ncbi:hypothetical protein BY996DRAFT_8414972 [Phakopsora pachyrhizi]|nr:hypothetical protein BY996DRAFT_8532954 [Phakopsora pachyrhizi]KAI8446555.1 hypothetical protein BY996DRAFT_6422326 [Phakopsora pachyrhizi]KAI8448818.1 hypothetical protein BY996DRAFT_8414972 [Phakopsora pachyrhizi]
MSNFQKSTKLKNSPTKTLKLYEKDHETVSSFLETIGLDKKMIFSLLDEYYASKRNISIDSPDGILSSPISTSYNQCAYNDNETLNTLHQINNNDNCVDVHEKEADDQEFSNEDEEDDDESENNERAKDWDPYRDIWYDSEDPVPTPVQGSKCIDRTTSWDQSKDLRTVKCYILFSDYSQLWSKVEFDVKNPFPPKSSKAWYRPAGRNLSRETLIESSVIYGSQVVEFAKIAESEQRIVGQGDSWDLANEALRSFKIHSCFLAEQQEEFYPVTSIARRHGILLYHGFARGMKDGDGVWYEVEDLGNVRAGDIIEWRSATCDTINPTYTCNLGNPYHAAIIIDSTKKDNICHTPDSFPPHELGDLTVIEQSLGELPARRNYKLSSLFKGDVWIYRATSLKDLLGGCYGSVERLPPCEPYFTK